MLYVFLANFRLSKDTSDHKFERRIIKQIINLKTNPGILFSEALYSGENQQSQSRVRAHVGPRGFLPCWSILPQLSLAVFGPRARDGGSVLVATVGCEGGSRPPLRVVPETHSLDTP